MIIQAQVGPQSSGSLLSEGSSTGTNLRLSRTGSLITEAFAHDEASRGAVFYGSNGATPSVTTVALATTYTGLCLYNPADTGVILRVLAVGYSFLVAFPAAATIGLLAGYSAAGIVTASAAASPGADVTIGSTAIPAGKCALSATLVGTPYLHSVFGAGLTAAITTTPETGKIVDMTGRLYLKPGAYAAIYTSTVSGAASLAGSFLWQELPA